jgi:hypothetical protein
MADGAGRQQRFDYGGAERARSTSDDDVPIAELHAASSPIVDFRQGCEFTILHRGGESGQHG